MEESLKERQEYLFLVVDNLLHRHESWSNDTAMQGLPAGGELWMAADQTVTAFDGGTIPASCHDLFTTVKEFSRHWLEHVTRSEVSHMDDLLPGNNLWAALDSIKAARKGAKPKLIKQLEPVSVLVKQKVSEVQIAKIYEWENKFGQPDMAKVRDAINNPGKWDGEAHVRVQEAREQKKKLQEQQQLAELRQRVDGKKNNRPTPGPESIETLIAQELTVAQVSSAKVMPVEEVLAYCREHGIDLSGAAPSSAGAPAAPPLAAEEAPGEEAGGMFAEFVDGVHDQYVDELGERPDEDNFDPPEGESLSLEQQIFNAADNDPNMKPGEIAKLLNSSAQKVAAILRRRDEIQEPV